MAVVAGRSPFALCIIKLMASRSIFAGDSIAFVNPNIDALGTAKLKTQNSLTNVK
jgi:hypothetical protein